jgi:hypothetical protein
LPAQLYELSPVAARQNDVIRKQDSKGLFVPTPKHGVANSKWLRLNDDLDWQRVLVVGQISPERLFSG